MFWQLIVKSEFIEPTYKKAYNRAVKRGWPIDKLNEVVFMLANQQELPPKYDNHNLKGKYSGYKECHIQPDWLLIYKIESDRLVLFLLDTGTHSDLFG